MSARTKSEAKKVSAIGQNIKELQFHGTTPTNTLTMDRVYKKTILLQMLKNVVPGVFPVSCAGQHQTNADTSQKPCLKPPWGLG